MCQEDLARYVSGRLACCRGGQMHRTAGESCGRSVRSLIDTKPTGLSQNPLIFSPLPFIIIKYIRLGGTATMHL
jgi:hypothetical protein